MLVRCLTIILQDLIMEMLPRSTHANIRGWPFTGGWATKKTQRGRGRTMTFYCQFLEDITNFQVFIAATTWFSIWGWLPLWITLTTSWHVIRCHHIKLKDISWYLTFDDKWRHLMTFRDISWHLMTFGLKITSFIMTCHDISWPLLIQRGRFWLICWKKKKNTIFH